MNTNLEKARRVRRELAERSETVYECPKQMGCRIIMLIPVQAIACRHGVMRRRVV